MHTAQFSKLTLTASNQINVDDLYCLPNWFQVKQSDIHVWDVSISMILICMKSKEFYFYLYVASQS